MRYINKLTLGKKLSFLAAVILVIGAIVTVQYSQRVQDPRSRAQVSPTANSADRFVLWVGCKDFVNTTDIQLQQWKDRGVDGFVCADHHLFEMGGYHKFTGDPNDPLVPISTNGPGDEWKLQRDLRDTRIVERAKAKGLKMYLSFYLVNAHNANTPLKDYFDDAGWRDTVIPRIRDITSAAKLYGFEGMAFDQELYSKSESAQKWPWSYPGNTHSEADVRTKVKQRGQEVMTAMSAIYPNLDLLMYNYVYHNDWKSVVQKEANGVADFSKKSTIINWLDGLSSVENYSAIRMISVNFHKYYYPASSWDNGMQYEANQGYSTFSRELSNWKYAASRIHLTPFSWIDDGGAPTTYDDPRTPEFVAEQLTAMRKWGTGGEFEDFVYGASLNDFDRSPYYSAMQNASTPGIVDSVAPTVNLTSPTTGTSHSASGNIVNLAGNTTDNMAIRSVTWSNNRGGSGAAKMTWNVLSGDFRAGYSSWQMDWNITGLPLQSGQNVITITAEDIKELKATRILTVTTDGVADTTAPVINNIASSNVAFNGATITWTTNEPSDSQIEYGPTTAYGSRTTLNAAMVTSHSVNLSNLAANSTYNLRVKSRDIAGNLATSANASFTTTSAPSITAIKVTAAPTIDGNLAEFAGAAGVTFGTPQTSNTATVKALWDNTNLYLGYHVLDTQLNAGVTTRDGELWNDDSVEWFLDTLGNGCTATPATSACMLDDDYQGILSLLNYQFDAHGRTTLPSSPNTATNFNWTSAVTKQGTQNVNTDTDTGYSAEIRIPWASIGMTAPTTGTNLKLGLALDDKDGSGSTSIMWPNITSAYQNASKWQRVILSGSTTPSPTSPTTPAPTNAPTLQPTIPPSPTPTPPPGSTSLSLNLLLHGIGKGGDSANPNAGGNTNPLRPQRNVKVEVFNSQNQLVLTKDSLVTYNSSNGSFTGTVDLGSAFASGIYAVKLKSDQFLRKLVPGIQNLTRGQANTLPQTTLTTGDMNNDNKIDVLDYNLLMDCFSDLTPARNCTDQTKKTSADLTDDGSVNQFDYNLFLRELTNISGE